MAGAHPASAPVTAGPAPRAHAPIEHLEQSPNGDGIRAHRDGSIEELDRRPEMPALDLALGALDDLPHAPGRSRRAHCSHPHPARATITSGRAADASDGEPSARSARPAHPRTSSN